MSKQVNEIIKKIEERIAAIKSGSDCQTQFNDLAEYTNELADFYRNGNLLAGLYISKSIYYGACGSKNFLSWHSIIDELVARQYPPAFYWKGVSYFHGYGVEMDKDQYFHYLKVAADMGHILSIKLYEYHICEGFLGIIRSRFVTAYKAYIAYQKNDEFKCATVY